jgi:phosphinothricin acetyltransferase
MEKDIKIRIATEEDAEQLLAIYRPYVEETAISFEYEVPTVEEFAGRIRNTLKRYPYLVAEAKGEIVGYAYASVFKERRAYDWSVETTIYLKQGCSKKGYGKKLYQTLEEMLKELHILNLNACIAVTDCEDAHLTNNSKEFHEHMGYRLVGTFHQSGYKFQRWYDMIWMEKMIGEHTQKPEEVVPFEKSRKMKKTVDKQNSL